MSIGQILGIAVGLAMDAFAVAIAAGLALPKIRRRHVFRLAFAFGGFQALMPIVGWFAGSTFSTAIAAYDHWIAFALLLAIGSKMLYEALFPEGEKLNRDPTRGWLLLTLSIATSLDALAVGLSMALLDVSIWQPALIIGIVAFLLTMLGIRFGSKLGVKAERYADVLGGTVLILIGVRILLTHLFAS